MIGIAIINYKSYQKTMECIDSIRKTLQIPYKIYLLENGSENESAEILINKYMNSEDVKLLIEKENHGYARGNNLCIHYMRKDGCKIGVISNNDIICTQDSIQTLVSDLQKYHDFLLVGPKILSPKGEFQKSVKLKRYTRWEYIKRSTYLVNFFKKENVVENRMIQEIDQFIPVNWVSGAFFAFDIEKMNELGDFDPNTFLFFEEYIMSEKAEKKNYKLGYDPNATVYHYHAYSTGGGLNIISKIAADRSERYYMTTYANVGKGFLFILEIVRILEVLFTFGKMRNWESIRKYLAEVRVPLK